MLGFNLICDFATFTKNSENYLEKRLNNGIEVLFAI